MVEKKKEKKRSSVMFAFLFGLAIGCLVSCVFVSNFLIQYSQQAQIPVVNVDVTNDDDKLFKDDDKDSKDDDTNKKKDEIDYTVVKKFHPNFKVEDSDGTWVAQNNVNIFKMAYDNETGDITVDGVGIKVIAPGTTNSYYFDLVNSGDCGVDYSVMMSAELSNNITSIPVEVKLSDYQGKYIIGSETTWDDVMAINDVKEEGQLSKGHKMRYNFSWQWPFESGNDEYDTMLGNLAVNEDVTLTITIKTLATADAEAIGGVETGDSSHIMTYALVAGVAGCAMIFLLLLGKKRKDDEDED